jgi:drug/metabolite transporter (DMT)-like permease
VHAAPGHLTAARVAPLILFAFLVIYVVWGSTYLGIKIAGETLPPFLLAGARFIVAGAVLFAWGLARRAKCPTRREWLGAAGVGSCLIVFSNALIVSAERHVDSGVVALFTAVTPILIAVFNRSRTGVPIGTRRTLGMVLGTLGLIVLASDTLKTTAEPVALLMILVAIVSWAYGSTHARDWPQPGDVVMQSGAQMLTGGAIAFVLGIAIGELGQFDPAAASTRSIAAWIYLTVMGSMLGYTCYQYLLTHVDATKVATSSYVNPVVAILLGVTLGGEALNSHIGLATLLLVPGVALVVTAPAAVTVEPPPSGGGDPTLPLTPRPD